MGDEGAAVLNAGLIELNDGVFCHVYRRKHSQLAAPAVKRVVRRCRAFCKATNMSAKLRTSGGNAVNAPRSSHAFRALPCSSARYVWRHAGLRVQPMIRLAAHPAKQWNIA